MLLIDMSNMVFSTANDYHRRTGEQIDLPALRALTLDSLKSIRNKLKEYSDTTVLCFDSAKYWRRDIFPHYKASRSKARDKSTMDWKQMLDAYEELKVELKENLPFHCLSVHGAEADDLISTLALTYAQSETVCIASSDTDFLQLQMHNKKIKQWSLYHKKFISQKTENYDFFEHIVKGDAGDGIPNVFSDDDTFVNPNKRQKQVREKNLLEWAKTGLDKPEVFCENADDLKRLQRNIDLIDLTRSPESLKKEILDAFQNNKPSKMKLFNYLVKTRLTRLMDNGGL